MNTNRKHAEAERADGVRSRTLGRRGVLGGLAAIPVLYGVVGSAAPVSAAAARRDGAAAGAGDLVQGVQRRYNAPPARRSPAEGSAKNRKSPTACSDRP